MVLGRGPLCLSSGMYGLHFSIGPIGHHWHLWHHLNVSLIQLQHTLLVATEAWILASSTESAAQQKASDSWRRV